MSAGQRVILQPTARVRWALPIAALLSVVCGFAPSSALAADPPRVPIATAPYGSPEITSDSTGTTINAKAPVPATGSGRYYRPVSPLDPDKVYKVTVNGTPTEGNFVLRLGRDGKLDYRAAPDGEETWWVSGTTKFELLLFSPVPAKYLMRGVRIDECPACKSDADLKQQIIAETPGLESALKGTNTHAKAAIIMRWLAPRITWGSGTTTTMVEPRGRGAAELYYDYFEPLRRGVYCAGATDFYTKVLKIFGIPSFPFHFGTTGKTPKDLTHATVLIPFANDSGGTDYRLLDPTFNLDVSVKATNKPASVEEMFEYWRAGRIGEVSFNTRSLDERRILLPTGPISCRDARSRGYDCTLSDWLNRTWNSWFAANGYDTGAAGLIQVMGTEQVFNPASYGNPQDFLQMHAAFKSGGTVTDIPPAP